jgi:hypothetical protein
MSRYNLAVALVGQKKFAAAEEIFRADLPRMKDRLGENAPATLLALNGLGQTLFLLGRPADAEPYLLEYYRRARQAKNIPAKQLREAGLTVVNFYRLWGRPEQAREWEKKLATDKAP